jgi:hypothetical protein
MLYRVLHALRHAPFCGAVCLGVAGVVLVGAVLVGCQPTAEATLPPATTVVASPPAPATAMAESEATATQPEATPTTPVPTESTATPATEVQERPTEAEPFQLTILHTNDVYGEVDPCG